MQLLQHLGRRRLPSLKQCGNTDERIWRHRRPKDLPKHPCLGRGRFALRCRWVTPTQARATLGR